MSGFSRARGWVRPTLGMVIVVAFLPVLVTFLPVLFQKWAASVGPPTGFPARKHFVVLSTGVAPLYSFFLPLSALTWKRVQGFEPIILLMRDVPTTRQWGSDKQTAVILHWLQEWGFSDSVYYLDYNSSLPDNNVVMSQVVRLFVSGMCQLSGPIADANKHDAVIVTTDVDILPIAPGQYWLPTHTSAGKITNSHCCGQHTVRGVTFREFPISTLAFPASAWREVMQYGCICNGAEDCANGSILSNVNAILEDVFFYGTPRQTPTQWNMDQRLVSYKLHNSPAVLNKTELQQRKNGDRVDRAAWPVERISQTHLAQYADSHMLRPGFTPENWSLLGQLLKAALQVDSGLQKDTDLWQQVELYVEQYRAAVSSGPAPYLLMAEQKKSG